MPKKYHTCHTEWLADRSKGYIDVDLAIPEGADIGVLFRAVRVASQIVRQRNPGFLAEPRLFRMTMLRQSPIYVPYEEELS
ncbi:MAG: hypothetical protein KGY78_10875 [Anaerolineae bacterium]|nr:hypothetical protein [Anaerolineae bacterium]